ncbi:hypothetical protein QJ043_09150 [Olsenella sp. YH-ols2217]|uniref:Tetratricopeptide repeat protein n=1 Tax=Kribbibacterium absianum TaxID=3044210 RepID=A0ABT6ZNK4_9ACTN|nr:MULTISPECIES: hypothetical protein [unclassified Olsenella]MDJ1122345.1 hypothetical protein [Olsenella sp. YH-ols2216]MDJ1130241.1 hypothetical protein [Olsenella sp. YH-ols2217]
MAAKGKRSDVAGFIRATLGDEPTPEAQAWARDEVVRPERRLVVGLVATCVVGLSCLLVAQLAPTAQGVLNGATNLAVVLALVLFFLLFSRRQKLGARFAAMLDDQCDPVAYGDRYLAYLELEWPEDRGGALWNYARALRWQGRWAAACDLMAAYERSLDHKAPAQSRYLVEQIRAHCAFDQRRLADLIDAAHALQALDEAGLPKTYSQGVAQTVALANQLTREEQGDWDEAFLVWEGYFNVATPVQKALFALHLARCAPSEKDSRPWASYASANGGTTWCAAAGKKLKWETHVSRR